MIPCHFRLFFLLGILDDATIMNFLDFFFLSISNLQTIKKDNEKPNAKRNNYSLTCDEGRYFRSVDSILLGILQSLYYKNILNRYKTIC